MAPVTRTQRSSSQPRTEGDSSKVGRQATKADDSANQRRSTSLPADLGRLARRNSVGESLRARGQLPIAQPELQPEHPTAPRIGLTDLSNELVQEIASYLPAVDCFSLVSASPKVIKPIISNEIRNAAVATAQVHTSAQFLALFDTPPPETPRRPGVDLPDSTSAAIAAAAIETRNDFLASMGNRIASLPRPDQRNAMASFLRAVKDVKTSDSRLADLASTFEVELKVRDAQTLQERAVAIAGRSLRAMGAGFRAAAGNDD